MIYVLDKYDRLVVVLCTDNIVSEGVQVLSAKTKEVNGGASTIEVTIDSSHKDAGLISDTEHHSLLFRDSDGEWQQFYISEIEDNHSLSMTKTLFGESVSQELYNTFCTKNVSPADLDGDPRTLIKYCLAPSRWVLGECDLDKGEVRSLETKNKSVSQLVDECASLYKASYRFRIEVDAESNIKVLNRYVDFKKSMFKFKGKVFSVGKDIVSLKRSVDASNVKTAIIPVVQGSEGEETPSLSISDIEWSTSQGDPVDKPKGQEWVGDPEALKQWGYYDVHKDVMGHRFMVAEFSEATTPLELLRQAWAVLKMNTTPTVSYEIKVVDLYRLTQDEDLLHEHFVLGERVRVVDKDFSPPLIVDANIVELEKDLLDPTNDLVVIGNPRASITDNMSRLESSYEDLGFQMSQIKESTYFVSNATDSKITITPKPLLQVSVALARATEVLCYFSATVIATQKCNLYLELENNGTPFTFKPIQTLTEGYNMLSFQVPLSNMSVMVQNILTLKAYTSVGEAKIEVQQGHLIVKGSNISVGEMDYKFTGGEYTETLILPNDFNFKFKNALEAKRIAPINQQVAHKEMLNTGNINLIL